MDLTDAIARDIVRWYGGKLDDADFYLNFPGTDWMLYGVTDAQKLYLMTDTVIADLMSKQVAPDALGTDMVKALIDAARKGVDKTQYKEVSNYWLKRISSIPTDAKKAHAKLGLDVKRQSTSADARDLKKIDKAIKATGAANKQDDRGQFVNRFLNSARYSLVRDWDREGQLTGMIASGSPALKAPETTESGNDRSLDSVMQDLTIRRMCKFLIYDSIRQGKGIAYLLDDIDLDRVAFMVQPDGAIPDIARVGDDKKVPICTSEIREIFRNWDALQGKVYFYQAFRQCDPPWHAGTGSAANMKAWSGYAAHRATKILSDKTGIAGLGAAKANLDGVVKAYAEGRDTDAVTLFHQAHPSRLDKQRFLNSTIAGREVKSLV
jgi:hypothetical protein